MTDRTLLGSRPKLRALWERLRASLWFLPLVTIICAVTLALVLPMVDQAIEKGGKSDAWYLYAGQPEGAQKVLSTIASSMLSISGVVFSITILVLQLASSQFSPRVLRTFLRDRTSQAAMATFLGSFVYAMMLLPRVRSSEDGAQDFVPALSVIVAMGLVLVSVLMLVRYIHHMAESIRAVRIIGAVSDDAKRTMRDMYPEIGCDDPVAAWHRSTEAPHQVVMKQSAPGVLTAVDERALFSVACERDVIIELKAMTGDFVPEGAPLFAVWGTSVDADVLSACVVFDIERSSHQDPLFGIRQLVDIAERALSPGINDPSTAVQALDQIHDLLRFLAVRTVPTAERRDADGSLRLILPRPEWDAYVRLGLDEIRQYGARSIQVLRKLRVLLEDLLSIAPEHRKAVLHEQLAMLDLSTKREFDTTLERQLVAVTYPFEVSPTPIRPS
jgi:uncharacterized membrane protein